MASAPESTDDVRRQAYIADRQLYIDMEREASRLFDQAMITLSTGALALSLTFFHDFHDPAHVIYLHLAWVMFSISILSTLGSFPVSRHAATAARNNVDRVFAGKGEDKAMAIWNRVTEVLNTVSIATFILGVWLLVRFAVLSTS